MRGRSVLLAVAAFVAGITGAAGHARQSHCCLTLSEREFGVQSIRRTRRRRRR